ncbi:MAG: hypothetical protein HKO59_16980 [Phycisphaerales bacterium]|nr:hypothetical protein [Phycisphaerae bacterium]NNF42415.1 hypothetical protein [Phycisphaerales bacterium]NNM27644.1 hypothetical protein [Phycisphaerales bacterium]
MKTLAWGLFGACSWTWCIGMYLPVVMMERYGLAGFVVFAIPNIVGCAGFGYVLATAARSRALVHAHRPAMVVFSLVAIAFQLFFAGWLMDGRAGWSVDFPAAAQVVPVALFAVGLVASLGGSRIWLTLAAVVYAVSLIAFALMGGDVAGLSSLRAASELAWVTPIILVGFLLCPYLDLTFHRMVQESPSRHAFGIFGGAFAVMIVMTIFVWFSGHERLPALALAHLFAQMGFTVGAHLREVRIATADRPLAMRTLVLLSPLLALAALPLTQLVTDAATAGDDTYLRFLVFYGLAFPAYVLLFVGPWRPLRAGANTIAGFGLIVLGLAPLYELGFIHHRAMLLAVPVLAFGVWAIGRGTGK